MMITRLCPSKYSYSKYLLNSYYSQLTINTNKSKLQLQLHNQIQLRLTITKFNHILNRSVSINTIHRPMVDRWAWPVCITDERNKRQQLTIHVRYWSAVSKLANSAQQFLMTVHTIIQYYKLSFNSLNINRPH